MGRGEKGSLTAEAPEKIPGETEAVCAEQRRNYTSGEARRVGVSFAVAAKDAHSSVILGAQDTDKTIAAIEGPVPDDAGDVELTEDSRMTLGEWLDRWLEQITSVLQSSTPEHYRSDMEHHVKLYLG